MENSDQRTVNTDRAAPPAARAQPGTRPSTDAGRAEGRRKLSLKFGG